MFFTPGEPPLGSALMVKPQTSVNSVHLLVIPWITLAPQCPVTLPKTPTPVAFDYTVNCLNNLRILDIIGLRRPIIGRSRNTDAGAASPHRKTVFLRHTGNSLALLERP
jgi:hypothetical protein